MGYTDIAGEVLARIQCMLSLGRLGLEFKYVLHFSDCEYVKVE